MNRILDVLFSLLGLIILSPFYVLISLLVLLDSKGPIFYRQIRVGRNSVDFGLLKFRTMKIGADKMGLLTVGERDPRITNLGYFLRKYKIDELPQLWNVLVGDMSLVGPRPEVRRYVELYTIEQQKILNLRPGITDWASIKFRNENEILARAIDPEKAYIEEVMPEKIKLNLIYINRPTTGNYLEIIFKTFASIIK